MSYCKYLELECFPYSQRSVCVIFIHSFIPLDKYLLRVYSVPPSVGTGHIVMRKTKSLLSSSLEFIPE